MWVGGGDGDALLPLGVVHVKRHSVVEEGASNERLRKQAYGVPLWTAI